MQQTQRRSRRKSILAGVIISLIGMGVMGGKAGADNYPNRAIMVTTPTAAGGGTDVMARIIADRIAAPLGQAVSVSNKPGAGGLIGTRAMLNEKNDGYSLFVTANNNQLIVPWMYSDAGFNPVEDFDAISAIGLVSYILVVHPSFPATNLKDFLQEIKANPGKYQYASAGAGTLNHLNAVLLAQRVGTTMEHVPYKGVAPATMDVIGNRVPVLFGALPAVIEHVKSGKLRALGVSSPERSPLLPDVPSISEELPGFGYNMWVAMYAPKGVPANAVNTVAKAMAEAKKDPEIIKKFEGLGITVMTDGPAELDARVKSEYAQWQKVVEDLNLKVN